MEEKTVVESSQPQEIDTKVSSLHPLEEKKPNNWVKTVGVILVALLIVAGGAATGKRLATSGDGGIRLGEKPKIIKSEKVVGSTDTKTFRDSAEGVLEKGGIEGEGTHHLIREGGPSQTAYLTSSIIDLDQYAGRKVKVWGETFTAQKAGWLMDVGKIELLE